MKIIDLNDDYKDSYCMCLEDWSDEMKEAGNHKCEWYEKMKDKGLIVKLALDDEGNVGGMIQCLPIKYSKASGDNLYFIDCTWVHGYKEGRGDFTGQGMGSEMLKALEEDVKARGADGIVAWGLMLPIWMKASWYKKRGYKKVDRDGIAQLVWKPFKEHAVPPKWLKQQKKPQKNENPGKVTVTAFYSGHCPAQNIPVERAKKASLQFGDKVVFKIINTFDIEVLEEWGIQDAIFVEDKNLTTGPPLTTEQITKAIQKKVKKL